MKREEHASKTNQRGMKFQRATQKKEGEEM